jgi:hypothetical protein
MAGTDVTTLTIALAGMAGAIISPWFTQRGRRWEIREQGERQERERQQVHRDELHQHRRDLYAALNHSARIYRSCARDVALDIHRGDPVDATARAAIDSARDAYREHYAQAQMVLPQRILDVAEEVNRCLGHGYELVRRLIFASDPKIAVGPVLAWFRGPLSDATHLLQQALREDLGTGNPVPDLAQQLARLAEEREHHGAEAARD